MISTLIVRTILSYFNLKHINCKSIEMDTIYNSFVIVMYGIMQKLKHGVIIDMMIIHDKIRGEIIGLLL